MTRLGSQDLVAANFKFELAREIIVSCFLKFSRNYFPPAAISDFFINPTNFFSVQNGRNNDRLWQREHRPAVPNDSPRLRAHLRTDAREKIGLSLLRKKMRQARSLVSSIRCHVIKIRYVSSIRCLVSSIRYGASIHCLVTKIRNASNIRCLVAKSPFWIEHP